jgi:hypothetical protein
MLWPSLIVAILACIVASQAVITGSFQVRHNKPFFLIERRTDLLAQKLAFIANHETFLLSASQSHTHFKNVPWTSVYSNCKLDYDDWDSYSDCCLY